MFNTSSKAVAFDHRLALRLAALAALVLFSFITTARAQGVGSTRDPSASGGGSHVIQGRVFTPSGATPATPLRVRLDSIDIGSKTATTDNDGSFKFTGLASGNYTVTIEGGKEYEDAREYPELFSAGAGARTVNLTVQLRPKGSGAASSSSTAFAGVPKQAVDLYNKGMEFVKKGDSKKAAEQLKAAVEAHPAFAVAWNELGVQYMKQNQFDKAAEALSQAVKLSPEAFAPRLNYGMALWNAKKYPEAETELRTALKKSDVSQSAHYYLGLALISQKKNDEAQTEFERAISLGKGKDDIAMAHRYLGGILWGKREYQRAADELEIYLKLSPNAPDAEKIRASIAELRKQK